MRRSALRPSMRRDAPMQRGAIRARRLAWALAVCLALAGSIGSTSAQTAPASFSMAFAEEPARLARGTSLYRAGRGAALRELDLLESGPSGLQLDARGATVALGPATRVYIARDSELVLLDGWLKLQCPAGRALTVATPRLQASCAGATLMLRTTERTTDVFAETGSAALYPLDAGKRGRPVTVADQHFATRGGAGPLRIVSRAPATFIQAVPPGFRDQLVPLAGGPPTLPQRERAASYAELAPWLAGQPLLRQRLARRFDPPPPRPPRRAAAHPPASTNQHKASQ